MEDEKTDIILKRALYDAMKIQVNTYNELDNDCNYEFSEEFKLKMNNLMKFENLQSGIEKKCRKIHTSFTTFCVVFTLILYNSVNTESHMFIKQIINIIENVSRTIV